MAYPKANPADAMPPPERQRFVQRLDLILYKLESVARRRRMKIDEQEEFVSWALLRMIESDYSVVREWRGDARFSNYLNVVVSRLLLDFRNHRWGKFRVSRAASRLGRHAELLDVYIHRDGLSEDEAVEMVVRNHRTGVTRKRLRDAAQRLPERHRRRMQRLDDVPPPTVEPRVDDGLRRRERRSLCRELQQELDAALADMDAIDLRILVLRYRGGRTAAEIGRDLGLPRRRVYQRIETILARLRRHLCGCGFQVADLLELVDAKDVEVELSHLRAA